MNLKKSFHPYAATTIIFWSLTFIFTKFGLQHFSAFALGFLRHLFASAALVIVALVTKMPLPKRSDLPWFFASGGTGFFLYILAFNLGQATVTASTASIIIATVPVITALLARLVYAERLTKSQWAAIAIEFFGVAILVLMKGVLSINRGLLWLLLGALTMSVYNLIQRKLTKTYSALQTATYSIFAGTILLAVFAPASFREAVHAPAIQFANLALLGVFSSAVAYVSWTTAFSIAPKTSLVSNYMFATPFLASILGFLVAKEIPDSTTLVGGGIILIGVLIFNFGGKLQSMLTATTVGRAIVPK